MEKNEVMKSPVPPVIKELEVPLPIDQAFELFTKGISTWWPLHKGHSVGGKDSLACMFEEKVGGRLYETTRDGSEHLWGTIQVWEPPYRLVTTWHPGSTPECGTRLEVSFTEGETGTRVKLHHSGWEARGTEADRFREGYESGWEGVLAQYVHRAFS